MEDITRHVLLISLVTREQLLLEFCCSLLESDKEQILLATEIMKQEAFGDACLPYDLIG